MTQTIDRSGRKLTLRTATEDDLAAIAGLEKVCFSDPWSEQSIREMFKMPSVLCLTAWGEVDRTPKLAGYLFAYGIPPEGEVATIATAPEFRRRGVGRALLNEMLSRMTAKGCNAFFLEVRESNAAARALYEQQGFEYIGRRKHYYRFPVEDALTMARIRKA